MSCILRNALLSLLPALLITGCSASQPEFSYEGPTGPAHWGDLDPAWRIARTGEQQSPVNIQDATEMEGRPLTLDYKPTPLDLVNNGHTIQQRFEPGSTITLGAEVFALKQFHFHTPSEHQVNGVHRALEVHLVHVNDVGQLLVLAVLFDVGEANEFLAGFWDDLPPRPASFSKNSDIMVDVRDLLPENMKTWRYLGSLTTPPCTEGVIWIVVQDDAPISDAQSDAIRGIMGRNNRPIQQLFGRIIKSVDGAD